MSTSDHVKVYTVNGTAAGSSSSLPDWLTRKRSAASKGKRKREIREHVEGTIELIQGFEFSEASNKVKTTPDGRHAIATGTYKPQIKVWELDQLTQKFERHTDAENVDFIVCEDRFTLLLVCQVFLSQYLCFSVSRMTGRSRYTCRMIAQWNCTLKVVSIIELASLALDVR